MAKQIAILEYDIIFDPTEAWSSGYQFEKLFADFFTYYGFDAQIVEATGNSGKRVIWITKAGVPVAQKTPQPKDSKPAATQIKQVQDRRPQSSFKQYVKQPQQQAKVTPKLSFRKGSSDNKQGVRQLPHINFRRIKNG